MASYVLAELEVPKPNAGKVCPCCVPDPVVFRFRTGFRALSAFQRVCSRHSADTAFERTVWCIDSMCSCGMIRF